MVRYYSKLVYYSVAISDIFFRKEIHDAHTHPYENTHTTLPYDHIRESEPTYLKIDEVVIGIM